MSLIDKIKALPMWAKCVLGVSIISLITNSPIHFINVVSGNETANIIKFILHALLTVNLLLSIYPVWMLTIEEGEKMPLEGMTSASFKGKKESEDNRAIYRSQNHHVITPVTVYLKAEPKSAEVMDHNVNLLKRDEDLVQSVNKMNNENILGFSSRMLNDYNKDVQERSTLMDGVSEERLKELASKKREPKQIMKANEVDSKKEDSPTDAKDKIAKEKEEEKKQEENISKNINELTGEDDVTAALKEAKAKIAEERTQEEIFEENAVDILGLGIGIKKAVRDPTDPLGITEKTKRNNIASSNDINKLNKNNSTNI